MESNQNALLFQRTPSKWHKKMETSKTIFYKLTQISMKNVSCFLI